MKNIYLIGDSLRFGAPNLSGYNFISPGYEKYVREKLAGVANVLGPPENCRFAQYTLRFLSSWTRNIPASQIDVVHWNNGAWDALRMFDDDPLTPIDVYAQMLKRIYKRIRLLMPNAKVVFALTTPMIEAKQDPNFFRKNSEIQEYNRVACEVMKELGVPVNDLYTFVSGFDDSYFVDYAHLSEKGCSVVADEVAEVCLKLLEK